MPISPRTKEYLIAKTNPALATALSLEKVREIAKQMAIDVVEREIGAIKIKAEEAIYRELVLIDKTSKKQLSSALKGDKGEPGDKGNPGDKGDTVIVEKVIEKTEVIKEQPIIREISKITNEIKEVAVTDKPEVIAEKLNTLEEAIDQKVIKGLDKRLKNLKGGGKKGGSGTTVNYSDLTSQCNGVTKTFTIPYHTRSIALFGTSFPIVFRPVVDYTISGTVLTLTSEVVAPATGQTLVFIYG